jgi:hypothetical protein
MSGERPGSAQEFPKGTNQTCYCAEMFVPWCALRLFDAENVAKPIPLLLVPARDSSLDPELAKGGRMRSGRRGADCFCPNHR